MKRPNTGMLECRSGGRPESWRVRRCIIPSFPCLALLTCLLAGCPAENYKADADKRVYDIIDSKWDPSMGPRANYRVSDVTSDSNDIHIDAAVPASGVLTLPHALALATAYNSSYQRQKERLYQSALDLKLVEHRYDTQLFGGASSLYGHNWQNSDKRPLSGEQMVDESQSGHTGLSAKHPQSEIVQSEGNVGFNRMLATGGQVGVGIAAGWTDILTGRGDKGLNSIFSATLSQPLLRGSDPMIVMEKLTQAERNVLYEIRTFNRFRKTFAVSVATDYLRTLELYDDLGSTQSYYDALAALESRVTKLAEAGMTPQIEVGETRQDVLRARDALAVAQRKYEQSLDQLKATVHLPVAADLRMDVGLLIALQARGLPRPDANLGEAVETALVGRLDVANRADATLDAQRAIYVAADKLRTDLRLKADVDVDARGHGTVWAGPVLDLPLDRVPEQHEYRRALTALEVCRREYDDLADKVRLEVRDAHRRLAETAERYEVAGRARETAEKRLKTASTLLQYGQASARRSLDAQRDLYDACKAETNALVEYAIATLEFYRDTETLQVRPDGMWEAGGLNMPATAKGLDSTGN
jgi:outer membrane protein TolC